MRIFYKQYPLHLFLILRIFGSLGIWHSKLLLLLRLLVFILCDEIVLVSFLFFWNFFWFLHFLHALLMYIGIWYYMLFSLLCLLVFILCDEIVLMSFLFFWKLFCFLHFLHSLLMFIWFYDIFVGVVVLGFFSSVSLETRICEILNVWLCFLGNSKFVGYKYMVS